MRGPSTTTQITRRGSTPESERLLVGCDPGQVVAITSHDQPLCILAGAGSGKTRVLTRRIAWRVLEGDALAPHVLTLTFTRKAAAELRGRLASLGLRDGVSAGTFHAIALSELRRLAAERREPPPVVLNSKARLLHGVLGQRRAPEAARIAVHEVAGEIEWAKSRLVAPGDYEGAARRAGRRTKMDFSAIAELYEGYERERRRRRVLDFEDLLSRCAAELADDPEFAASAQWRLRHLFVDEYQDLNAAQLRLLKAWDAGRGDLCVVGDPDQAIYAWNGSDPEIIGRFPKDFPGAKVIRLQTNYRSTAEVLAVASAVLDDGVKRAPREPGGPVPEGPVPTVTAYASEEAEARGVVRLARRAHRPGRRWSSVAVLARTNAQLPPIARAFADAGIPARIVGETGFLARPHLADALGRCYDAADRDALAAVIADLRLAGAGEAPGEHDEEEPRLSSAAIAEREDRETLAALVEDYLLTDGHPSGTGLRSFFETAHRGEDTGRGRDAVELITFHRAKGLEWPVVFVTGLEDGLVPITHARDAAALAEERRLLYVACTRAEEELHCSWSKTRQFGAGRPSTRSPSPHLEGIERARHTMELLARPSKEVARRAIEESRRLLAQSCTSEEGANR
jgi:DNA helicase-2/ATP-dependent DNA helicase PcrA